VTLGLSLFVTSRDGEVRLYRPWRPGSVNFFVGANILLRNFAVRIRKTYTVKGVSVSKEAQVAGSERKTETKKETKLINSVSDEKDTNAESVSSAPRLYEPPQQSKPKKSRRTSYDTPKSDKLVPGQMLGEKYKTQNVIPGLESDQDEEFEEAGSESD
jgi:hypothetical protein